MNFHLASLSGPAKQASTSLKIERSLLAMRGKLSEPIRRSIKCVSHYGINICIIFLGCVTSQPWSLQISVNIEYFLRFIKNGTLSTGFLWLDLSVSCSIRLALLCQPRACLVSSAQGPWPDGHGLWLSWRLGVGPSLTQDVWLSPAKIT